MTFVEDYLRRVRDFEQQSHSLLAVTDTSPSRIMTIRSQRQKLGSMSISQDKLMTEAIIACERGLYRSAIVMAWAAFFDAVVEKLYSDGFTKLHALRVKWSAYTSPEELQEAHTEHAIVEAARDLKLLGKAESKVAFGQLSRRNQCAHPTGYDPGLNDALGFVTDMLSNIEKLAKKTY